MTGGNERRQPLEAEPDLGDENFRVLKPKEFLVDFTTRAKKAKKNIWMQAMYFENDDIFNQLAQAFAEGGGIIDRRFQVDYFTHMVSNSEINKIPSFSRVKRRIKRANRIGKYEALDMLEEAGVQVNIINEPDALGKFFPNAGRSHIKMSFVDDVAWV